MTLAARREGLRGHAIQRLAVFAHAVEKCTAAKPGAGEPLAHRRRDGLWAAAMACKRLNKPVEPTRVPRLQKGLDQRVLAGEVPVEGDLGHARFGNECVGARGPNSIAIEQPLRGLENALARWRVGLDGYVFDHSNSVDRSVYMRQTSLM